MLKSFFVPGSYFIGDPVHAIKNWGEFIGNFNWNENQQIINFEGFTIPVGRTFQGECVYDGIHIRTGLVAMVPENLITVPDFDSRLGELVAFNDIINVVIEDGYFEFGDITIDTTTAEREFRFINAADPWHEEPEEEYEDVEYHGGEDHDIGKW